jgi:hypothetical protein
VNRRLGLVPVLIILAVTIAALVAITPLINGSDEGEPERAATATPGACTPIADPFGSPPDSFAYEKVDEKTRQTTIKALRLDDRVEMRAARRDGLTLGTLVGAPSKDPQAYVDDLVSTAEKGTEVSRQRGYTVIPLESGTVVAVGVRGCTAVMISAQDPQAVRFLAEAVFVESSPR